MKGQSYVLEITQALYVLSREQLDFISKLSTRQLCCGKRWVLKHYHQANRAAKIVRRTYPGHDF